MSSAVSPKRHPLLTAYLRELQTHPLRTKAATAAVLQFVQDALGNHIVGIQPRAGKASPAWARALAPLRADATSLKLALYGAVVQAPLAHVLSTALARAFAGRTGTRARLGMLLANNVLVAPINTVAFLASLAVIGGARSADQVVLAIRRGFFKVIRVTWVVSPTAMLIAQRYIQPEFWIIWFNCVAVTIGTYLSTRVKRARLEALRKAKAKDKGDVEPVPSL